MADAENIPPNATSQSVASEIQRLKQSYASRVADERPISHCVAVAYRQVIAVREHNNRKEKCPK